MMYECQLSIKLSVTKKRICSLDGNKVEDIEGNCAITKIAEGNLNGIPTLKGCTAFVDCKTNIVIASQK